MRDLLGSLDPAVERVIDQPNREKALMAASFGKWESLHSPKLKYGSYGSRDLKFVPRTAAVLVTVPSAPRGCVLAVRVRLAQPPTCQNDERLIQVSDKNENVDSRQESL